MKRCGVWVTKGLSMKKLGKGERQGLALRAVICFLMLYGALSVALCAWASGVGGCRKFVTPSHAFLWAGAGSVLFGAAAVLEVSGREEREEAFAAELSHELRASAAEIQGYVRLLRRSEDARQSREVLQILEEETGRLAALSGSLLTLTRLEQGREPLEAEPMRLDEELRRAFLSCQSQWEEKGLMLNLELDPVLWRGSRNLIGQLWRNLAENAVKYSPPGGTVDVSLARQEGFAVARLANQGEGIAPEALPHIFEKFYRANPGGDVPGNGLGLSLVLRIVQLYGGTVAAESDPGEKTVFTVTLPL